MQLQLLRAHNVPGRQPRRGEEEAKEKIDTFSIADHTFSNVCSINIYKTELRSKNIYIDTLVNRAQEFQSKKCTKRNVKITFFKSVQNVKTTQISYVLRTVEFF